MSVRYRNYALALAAVVCLVVGSVPALAQDTFELKGQVTREGSKEPFEGATIDVFRFDVKAEYSTTTDAEGKYSLMIPKGGTYAVVVSHPTINPQYQKDLKPSSGLGRVNFAVGSGGGGRPSYDDVKTAIAAESMSDDERKKLDEENAKKRELGTKFNEKKEFFDSGVKALNSKKYSEAVADLSKVVDGLENADPGYWGELISKGGTALAEAHYQLAVENYNNKNREVAEKELRTGAKVVAMAIKYDPAYPVSYAVQGKTLLLLIDKFGDADQAETAARAFFKAAEMETTDKKRRVSLLAQAGDAYRAAYMTDQAIATYQKVLAEDSNNTAAMYGIGLAAMGTSEEGAKQREMYQVAANYLKLFVDKAGSDPNADEVKGLLATLEKEFKIKPKPIK